MESTMKRIGIVGCGYLANVVADALIRGLLPDYELVGAYSRTVAKTERLSAKMKQHGMECRVCTNLNDLLALKLDYLVETASPAGMREVALPALKSGASLVTLSIGALADSQFHQEVMQTAKENDTRVYIASGATGGFDVLRTATLMGNASANFFNEKGNDRLRNSVVYDPVLEKEERVVFSGTAQEAIQVFPTGLNVAVAASLASVGPEKMQVKMQSTPGFIGDTQRVEIKNDQVHATIDVYSATPEIAGWSIVSTLRNIASPIVF